MRVCGRSRTGSPNEELTETILHLIKTGERFCQATPNFACIKRISEVSLTVKHFLMAMIQIRNKTKAHGAFTSSDYQTMLQPFQNAVNLLVNTNPTLGWDWYRRSHPGGPLLLTRGLVSGETKVEHDIQNEEVGMVFVTPPAGQTLLQLLPLIRSETEGRDFVFANGGFHATGGTCEFLSYSTALIVRRSVGLYGVVPPPLPNSETHGLDTLEILSSAFNNLPPLHDGFIFRRKRQEILLARLLDHNHTIVTLHGPGGIGKTSLAIAAAHDIAQMQETRFEQIIWLSARDIDLTISGPKAVKQDILTLHDISTKIAHLTGVDPDINSLALYLQSAFDARTQTGTLFILDNFETLSNLVEIHECFDLHCHSPNKVLLTSRERAFKADYPILVTGMELAEAFPLMSQVSRSLRIEGIMTSEVMEKVFSFTAGHPYLMKLVVGEIAKEGRVISLAPMFGSGAIYRPHYLRDPISS